MADDEPSALEIFEAARPRLWGLAYRMLGSAADADDAVQDIYLRWQSAAGPAIETPEAWLTTACTRRCIDLMRGAQRARVDYVGPWLPEPLLGDQGQEAKDPVELASSLSMAFLLLLERLGPSERAAYLLHDVFDYDYAELAGVLDKSPAACRQLVSRARKRVGKAEARFAPEPDRQARLLDGFLAALRSGELKQLEALLAEDVALWTDGGGKVLAFTEVVEGAAATAEALALVWREAGSGYEFRPAEVNGAPGLMLWEAGALVGVLSLSIAQSGRIAGIYVVRNPDKLVRCVGLKS